MRELIERIKLWWAGGKAPARRNADVARTWAKNPRVVTPLLLASGAKATLQPGDAGYVPPALESVKGESTIQLLNLAPPTLRPRPIVTDKGIKARAKTRQPAPSPYPGLPAKPTPVELIGELDKIPKILA